MIAPKSEAFEPRALPATFEALFHVFDQILVLADEASAPTLASARTIRLEASGGPIPGTPGGPLRVRGWNRAATRPRADLFGVVEVSELSSDEQDELRAGVLSLRSAAGREVGWAARDLTGLKVGLALGAGSIRGYAHAGVIDVLRQAGLDFDYISGTSVGAAVAALVVRGDSPAEIADHLDVFAPNLFKLKVPFTSMLSDRGMRSYLRSHGRRCALRGHRGATRSGRGRHREPARARAPPWPDLAGGAREHRDSRHLSGPANRPVRLRRRRRPEPLPGKRRRRHGSRRSSSASSWAAAIRIPSTTSTS